MHSGSNSLSMFTVVDVKLAILFVFQALEVLSLVRSEINVETVLSGIKSNEALASSTLKQLNITGCRMTDNGAQVSMSPAFLRTFAFSFRYDCIFRYVDSLWIRADQRV